MSAGHEPGPDRWKPHALRRSRRDTPTAEILNGLRSAFAGDGFGTHPGDAAARLNRKHHMIIGAVCALVVGYLLNIGPWPHGTDKFLLPAGAQEGLSFASQSGSKVSAPSAADESALRYFARQGDVDRLEAELRRLRALYPDWDPPTNLLDPVGEDQQTQQIWNLYGEGRFGEARELLAQRQQRDPNWEAPTALVNALNEAEARERLTNASKLEQWQAVIRIASENPNLLVCGNVDVLWRVAEAFAKTDKAQRAYDAYAYVLENCPDTQERIATVEKASELLPDNLLEQLFQFGRTGPDGENEFAVVQLNTIRRAVGKAAEDPSITVPEAQLQVLAKEAATGRDTNDATLLGWYLYRHDNPQDGLEWFRFALERGHGVEAAQGFILSLRAMKDEARAREAAYIWRDTSKNIMAIYLEAVATFLTGKDIYAIDQETVTRFAPVVVQQKDPNGAQALGWYAYNTCQFQSAEDWFVTSAGWKPSEAALFGLALARLRLGDTVGFDEVVNEWGPVYPAVESLRTGSGVQPEAPSQTENPDETLLQSGVQQIDCGTTAIRDRAEEARARDRATTPTTGTGRQPVAAEPQRVSRTPTPRRDGTMAPVATAPAQRPVATTSQPVRTTTTEPMRTTTATGGAFQMDEQPAAAFDVTGSGSTNTSYGGYQPRAGQASSGGAIIYTGGAPNWGQDTSTATVIATGGPDVIAINTDLPAGPSRPTSRNRLIDNTPNASPAVRAAYSSGNYRQCVGLTDAAIKRGALRGGDALARGWCLMELKRPVEAAMAFEAAYTNTFDAKRIADAAYGETLSKAASNLTNEAAVAATKSPQPRTRRAEIARELITQRALAAYRDGKYADAIMALDERSRLAPEQRDLMLLRGYAHYNLGQWNAAEQIFEAVDKAASTPDSRSALNVIRFAREPQQRRY
ncbi:tetratricopeptide (TPR) repeat protein [Amorphus suaedae]